MSGTLTLPPVQKPKSGGADAERVEFTHHAGINCWSTGRGTASCRDGSSKPSPKRSCVQLFGGDESTAEINAVWPRIAPARFQEVMTAFGQWPGTGWSLLFYVIENEIHHRGQGYVYLRALGIEPPPFYER